MLTLQHYELLSTCEIDRLKLAVGSETSCTTDGPFDVLGVYETFQKVNI